MKLLRRVVAAVVLAGVLLVIGADMAAAFDVKFQGKWYSCNSEGSELIVCRLKVS